MAIQLKRAYDKTGEHGGTRVLVDRVWPRGVRKAEAGIDLWLKEIAPSTELRKWFGHDPEKWPEFKTRYFRELEQNQAMVEQLSKMNQKGTVTLVFGAKNEKYNNAAALKEYLEQRAGGKRVRRWEGER
jgi:uncharacterized protein YeaO (DUF488 family)